MQATLSGERRSYIMAKNKKSLFIGIRYLFNVFWTYQRSALVFLFLHCLIGGVLPFASIVIPHIPHGIGGP
jgi:hypothetical protein